MDCTNSETNRHIAPYHVHHAKTTLTRTTRRNLAQLRTNKCSTQLSYLNKIVEDKHPSPLFHLYKTELHTCSTAPKYTHTSRSRICGCLPWRWGMEWAWFPTIWEIPSADVPRSGCQTPPPLSVEGWGRQQQQEK